MAVRTGAAQGGLGRVALGEVSLKISTFNGKSLFEVPSQRKESRAGRPGGQAGKRQTGWSGVGVGTGCPGAPTHCSRGMGTVWPGFVRTVFLDLRHHHETAQIS